MTTTKTAESQGQEISRRELVPEVFNLLVAIWHTGAKTKDKLLFELIRAWERDVRLKRSVRSQPPRRISNTERSNLEKEMSLGLETMVVSGHIKISGTGNIIGMTRKGRELLLADPGNIPPRNLGVLSSDGDWEDLILKVLALNVNEEDYCFEDLVRDLLVLDGRFGYRVQVEAGACLQAFVSRTVRWLAGEWDQDIGRPKRLERPEIAITHSGDGREKIGLRY